MRLFRSRRDRASLGYRGWAVIHLALVWIVIGLSLLVPPPLKDQANAIEGHHTALLIANLPEFVQCGMWFVPAAVAIYFARSNPRRARDRISFEALVVPPAICLFSFGWAFLFNLAVHHHTILTYLMNVIIWGFLLSLTLMLSYWPEPTPRAVR